MNKMKITGKRCFALLLVLMMCFSLLPMSALADDGVQQCEYCKWTGGNHAPNCPNGSGTSYDKDDKGKDEEETNKPATEETEEDPKESDEEETDKSGKEESKEIETIDCGVCNHKMSLSGNQLVCSVCGATCGQVDENGHHKIDKETTSATCYSVGYAMISCDTCGTITEIIPALKADFTDQTWESCENGQHKMTCKNCNGTPEGHSIIASCVDKDNDGKCDDCGAEVKKVCDHRFGNHEDETQYKAPTCTEKGQRVYVCDECGGVVDNKEIPLLKPDFGEWTDNGNKTQTRVCVKCNGEAEGHSETKAIPEHEHTPVFHEGYPATCTAPGCKNYYCCSDPSCGKTFLDAEGKTPATKYNKEIPALGHDFTGATAVDNCKSHVDATCTEHTLTCVRCKGELKDGNETKTENHTYGEWITDTAATMTTEGTKHRVCSACEHTENGTIPTLDKVTITIVYKDGESPVKTETVVVPKGSKYDVTNEIKIPDGYEPSGNPENVSGTADDNKTVTVPVKKIVYTVTFDANGGSAVASQTVKHGDRANSPTTTRSGYTFNDWTLNGAAYNFSTPVTGNITLVARWTQNNNGGGIIITPTPPDEPDDPGVDIPDEPVPGGGEPEDPNEPDDPGVDIPDEPVPGGDQPDLPDEPDDPGIEIPDEPVPGGDRPVIPTRPVTPTTPGLTDIPDEEVPLADTPETGDNVWVWYLTALLSAAGIAVLTVLENKKRAKR